MTEAQLTFIRRFSSTAVLWALALWTILAGWEPGFILLIGGLGLTALLEYYKMLDAKNLPHFKLLGLTCGAVLLGGTFVLLKYHGNAAEFEIGALILFLFAVFARQMFLQVQERVPLEAVAFTLFGLLYIPWTFSFVSKIVYLVPSDSAGAVTGHWYVLFLLLVTKFSDMGAYLTGSMIGKHPMVPHLSPKKTWEGFFGALAFSTGGGCALLAILGPKLGHLGYRDVAILGLILGIAAVVGDLAESLLKRSSGVKDSGHFLPGIGGALDLIDSILFTAPIMYYYMRIVLRV